MSKRTQSGLGVLFPLRPFPIGFVFKNEDRLKKARARYILGLSQMFSFVNRV